MLFGSCEGLVGRVGPYVLPGARRALPLTAVGSSSDPLRKKQLARPLCVRTAPSKSGRPSPTHPVFLKSMTGLFGNSGGVRDLDETPRQNAWWPVAVQSCGR